MNKSIEYVHLRWNDCSGVPTRPPRPPETPSAVKRSALPRLVCRGAGAPGSLGQDSLPAIMDLLTPAVPVPRFDFPIDQIPCLSRIFLALGLFASQTRPSAFLFGLSCRLCPGFPSWLRPVRQPIWLSKLCSLHYIHHSVFLLYTSGGWQCYVQCIITVGPLPLSRAFALESGFALLEPGLLSRKWLPDTGPPS